MKPLIEALDGRFRAFPTDLSLCIGDISAQGWHLLDGHLRLPVLVLNRSALEHNLGLMASYCGDRGVRLAPHGKTTMAPQLISRQLEAGAWAVTAASAAQAQAFVEAGVGPRVLIANEVVDPASIELLAALRTAGVDVTCLVDSIAGVHLLDTALALPAGMRLPVLVELGVSGGRAGARTVDQARTVAEAVSRSAHLSLRGVECFEGVLSDPLEVDAFLKTLVEAAGALRPLIDGEMIVTAGGSLFFDRVVDAVHQAVQGDVAIVLRSGCYLTHDHGFYDRGAPWGSARAEGQQLRPALELWSHILSTPEPGLAIASFGKRDAPYDIDLPIVLRVLRAGVEVSSGSGLAVRSLNDQHAFVDVPPGVELQVGDVLVCGVSHPCTAFDKWSLLPLVDDSDGVIGAIRTLF